MKQQQWKAGLIVSLLVAMIASVALAGTGTAAPAPTKEAAPTKDAAKTAPAAPAAKHTELFWPEGWKAFHNPTPWLSQGLDLRLRIEAGRNWDTLNDSSVTDDWWYERYRTRWWTKTVLGEDISFNTRLVWEFRTYDEPHAQPIPAVVIPGVPYTPFGFEKYDRNMVWDEALFDWFNFNVRNIGGLPLTGTFGRQDMIFGVGWLVLDATPLDGSRTIGGFDAARLTYDWADTNTKIDLAYINRMAESDEFLEPICDKNRALTQQDENAILLYLTNTSFKPMQLEAFFIYRNDNPVDYPMRLSNMAPVWGADQDIYTFGAAISGTHGDHWKYRAEGAFQTGDREGLGLTPPFALGQEQDIEAFGVLSNLEYMFKDSHENATHIGYEYASGDDPGTDDYEQFNLLWGEWPRWSELLIYTYTFETEPSNNTNLHRANIGHRINVNKQWTVTVDYHALWSDQKGQAWRRWRPLQRDGINVGDGSDFRGSLVTAWLRYKFSDQLYGHFLGEYFFPGNYYETPTDDEAYFFRFNLEYIF